MGGIRQTRVMLLAGGALVIACIGAVASAQDVPASVATEFTNAFAGMSDGAAIDLKVRQDALPRFAWDAPAEAVTSVTPTRIELELAAGGGDAPLDVAIAQRATLGAGPDGQINRSASGSELRIGRGLVDQRDSSGGRSVYAFLASDDEALTWQPGARNEFGGQGGSLALQNQVQVGDLSAGVTYEHNGVQASLAYVEREESTRVGQQSFSQDQSFTGLTVTMRH